jgi:hypothetical protein
MAKAVISCLLCILIYQVGIAQLRSNQYLFDPIEGLPTSAYRSNSGMPGEHYWQNAADYEITAELNEEKQTVTGRVAITYTNNSPFDLEFLWLHLDQNKFKKDSRGTQTTPLTGGRFSGVSTDGFQITSVAVDLSPYLTDNPEYEITDTRMFIPLKNAVKENGGQVRIYINYSFEIPKYGADRMGKVETEDGWIFQLGQWYPRMAVFDDIKGWNVEPYLGAGEFYMEYGNFDYKITVPYDHIVVGSGLLMNPHEVLTEEQIKRLKVAEESDETVFIIEENEAGKPKKTRPTKNGTLTWHFKMDGTRDVAWASSPTFIWDAAKMNLSGKKQALAMSVYPPESAGNNAWGRSTEYVKASIEYYSKQWIDYPYPVAVNVAGQPTGMEYPGMSFTNYEKKREKLWKTTDHEFGHTWFPMIVGSNERLFPWMDEGLNIFMNHYCTKAFNNNEYDSRFKSIQDYMRRLTDSERESVNTFPDVCQSEHLGTVAYYKPGIALYVLRELVLGHERYDRAFKAYINRWAYKHPVPGDFFATMENVAGEELDWFWRGWLYSNHLLDQSVSNVTYVNDDPKQGARITVNNRKKLLMPVLMEITDAKGTVERVKLPVEIWQRGNKWTFDYDSKYRIKSIVIDPDKLLPDVNRVNNKWKSKD